MATENDSNTSRDRASKQDGFNLNSFLKPVAEVDTAIGKLFLFPLRTSDLNVYSKLSSREATERVRDFLPCIVSLSPDYSLGTDRVGVTAEQIQLLSDQAVDDIAEAYVSSKILQSLSKEEKSHHSVVKSIDESSIAFLDRLLRKKVQEEEGRARKLHALGFGSISMQTAFDQVRKSTSALGSTLTDFERLKKRPDPVMAQDRSVDHIHAMNQQFAHQKRERAEEMEMTRLTGKMTAESAKTLKDLAEAATTLMEQMDERDG